MTDSMQTDQGDVRGMLEKIRQLEAEKQQLAQEREQLSQEREQLSQRLDQTASKFSALSQKTQEEMMNKINTTIATWLASLPQETISPETKDQVKAGLHELAKATAQDSGLYQVMCCASEQHISNVTQLEEIRRERDELQQRLSGGKFAGEEDRVTGKRKGDVLDPRTEEKETKGNGMWDDFQIMLQQDKGWCVSGGPR